MGCLSDTVERVECAEAKLHPPKPKHEAKKAEAKEEKKEVSSAFTRFP